MSNTIPFASLTIPTPQPYDDKNEHRQRENFYYVLNQLLLYAAAADWDLPDPADLLRSLQDLKFNSITVDFGPFRFIFDGRVLTYEEA